MHDTHLIEKIYQAIVAVCKEHSIVQVNELCIEVDEGSHIDGPHLLSHLIERDSCLFGSGTVVSVEQGPLPKLSARIKSIDGDGCE